MISKTNFKPFIFKKSQKSKTDIIINTNNKSDKPLNRLLFGKFAEHLGNNIYNGMWAQILKNPVFAPWHFFSHIYRKWSNTSTLYNKKYSHYPVKKLLDSYNHGVACWWIPFSPENGSYLLSQDTPFISGTSQLIRINKSGHETGIEQPLFLPLHRINRYIVTLHARGNINKLKISFIYRNQLLNTTIIKNIRNNWKKFTTSIEIPKSTVVHKDILLFRITANKKGVIWLGEVLLFPEDNIHGFDPDIIKLIKESRISILRFPGGNFVSGYHWKDGVGPREKRPLRNNPAWGGIEPNYVGTDELIQFCRLVHCEPLICINAGNGTPQEAAQWVEYCNGSIHTEYGRLRKKNGFPEPHHVQYWEIGNELWGEWQIGYCSPQEYAERYEVFRKAMLKKDPNINIIACGQSLEWNKYLLCKVSSFSFKK